MFHVKNSICFERIRQGENYGGVRLCILGKGEEMAEGAGVTIMEMTASEWASVASSMTALGENTQTFGMMLALQK